MFGTMPFAPKCKRMLMRRWSFSMKNSAGFSLGNIKKIMLAKRKNKREKDVPARRELQPDSVWEK